MRIKLILTGFVFALLLISCSEKRSFNVAVATNKRMPEFRRLETIYNKYVEKNGKRFKLKLVDSTDFQFSTNMELLADSSSGFDMAIVNNTKFVDKDSCGADISHLKVVLPITSRILYVLYNKEKVKADNLPALLEGRNVLILGYEADFVKQILADFGVNNSKVNFLKSRFSVDDSGFKNMPKSMQDSLLKINYWTAFKKEGDLPYDIEIGFVAHNEFNNSRIARFLDVRRNYELFSLDDFHMYKNGSCVEGFCLRNKYFTPYLLPKGTYGEFPETPVLTIRQDFNLVAREDVSDEFIYELVKTALEETDFIDMNIYGKDFNNINFALGLHPGTRRYFDRSAPKFYEKYSELIGKIGTGVGGFYTAIVALILLRKKRKRKMINLDYQYVLDIQSSIDSTNDIDSLKDMFARLQQIQKNLHTLVIERKVLLDDTFKIFIDLINKNEQYILNKITNIELSKK